MTESIDLTNFSNSDLKKIQSYINKLVKTKKQTTTKKQKPKTVKKQNGVASTPVHKTKKVRRVDKDPEQEQSKQQKQCRVEPISTRKRRVNQFEKLDIFSSHKNDTETDKKLIGANEMTPRCNTRLVKVQCQECKKYYSIAPSLVYKEDGKIVYTCDRCIKTGDR